jgi:hypothetical protein
VLTGKFPVVHGQYIGYFCQTTGGRQLPRFAPGPLPLKNYESEATQFIRDFLKKHPEEVDKQRQARTTWWDRPQDFKERDRLAAAKVPKKGYEYY